MRGKLTDQDLTDYALNELDPHQRMYVESMLAVSVECRNDVYEMLDIAQMLEDGFERDSKRVPALLTGEQRAELVRPRKRRVALAFLHRAAATVAVAACVAFALANSRFWHNDGKLAAVTTAVSSETASSSDDISPWISVEPVDEESSDWLQVASDSIQTASDSIQAVSDSLPQPAVICTPPSWLEGSAPSISELH